MELRVWRIINPPQEPIFHKVNSIQEAHDLIDKLANLDLKKKWIWANAFGLEIKEKDEWEEWCCDKCGYGIEEHFDKCDNKE